MKIRNPLPLLMLAAVASLPIQGCATLQGPQKAAATAETAQERLELRGYAIERSYNILLEDALVEMRTVDHVHEVELCPGGARQPGRRLHGEVGFG